MQIDLTVTIHSYNEETNIESCIESAKLLSPEIVLIDMQSNDKTVALAQALGVTTYSFPYSSYVEPAREYGIAKTTSSWVFLLDADERMTKELANEIKNHIINSPYSSLKVPRRNMFEKGTWLKHGGWWPDYQIRLIAKKYFVSWPKQIHSTPQINGKQGYLHNPIIHYSHQNMSSMVEKTIIFENIESDLLYKADKQVSTMTFFRKFFGELYKRLIWKAGFLDGKVGIIESVYQAYSKTITYLYLYEKKIRSSV